MLVGEEGQPLICAPRYGGGSANDPMVKLVDLMKSPLGKKVPARRWCDHLTGGGEDEEMNLVYRPTVGI